MQYLGGKVRLSKYILPIMLKDRTPETFWVEPFVGGGNTMEHVTGNRIGGDIDEYIISMWRELQKGWEPPSEVSLELYNEVKNNQKKYSPALTAFIGYACSYGGKWFGGYARNKRGTNYASSGCRVLKKAISKMKDVKFVNCSYDELEIPDESIIYCDPPYRNRTSYKNKINSDHFYNWCVLQKNKGHKVYVTEYNAPDNFKCIWEKEIKINIDVTKTRVEKLYVPM